MTSQKKDPGRESPVKSATSAPAKKDSRLSPGAAGASILLPRGKRKKKHAGGRPTKLSKEVLDRVVEAMLSGAFLETAAQLAGIDRVTLHRWLKLGGRAKSERNPYRKFCNAVVKAQAEARTYSVAKVRGSGDWRAHAWFLERTDPDFRKREQVDVAPAAGAAIAAAPALVFYLPKSDGVEGDPIATATVPLPPPKTTNGTNGVNHDEDEENDDGTNDDQ